MRNPAPGSRFRVAGAIVVAKVGQGPEAGRFALTGADFGQTAHAAKSGSFAYAITGSVS